MISCAACHHDNPDGSSFCEGCGGKLHDPRRAAQEADVIEAEFRLDQVKKARSAFLIVAVLQVVGGLLQAAVTSGDLGFYIMVVSFVVAALFFGLAWWCKRQPFAAAIVGLFVFAGLHISDAIADPSAIYKGIVIKVIVIVMLVRAVRAGFAYRQFVRSRGLG